MRYKQRLVSKVDKRRSWHRQRPQDSIEAVDDPMAITNKRIRSISKCTLEDLPGIISTAALEANIPLQVTVLETCLRRILKEMDPSNPHPRNPRPEQVRTLRRLIFGHSDTLLIARTGFGKSLIFHAYSVLTKKITLQIIPLTKLGDEQASDIRRIQGTNPCVLDTNGKHENHTLLQDIRNLQYTHILLGPEQASSTAFRDILRDPVFQSRLGLVAIDECHLLCQWKDFRPAYAMLHELRTIVREDVVWFGCTGTLSAKAQEVVLRTSGLRAIGDKVYETEIIRTSIDRPDISICVLPILRQLKAFATLYFLLDESTLEEECTPCRIPKTIIFLDSIAKVDELSRYLQRCLWQKTSSYRSTDRYNQHLSNSTDPYSVYNVVQTFTSRVARVDQDLRYAEFQSPSSITRIMVATTSLGMGVNIPDVERVVIWKFPTDNEPNEVWQRVGRGGRGEGRRSTAYIFLPYWAFDAEGRDPVKGKKDSSAVIETTATRRRKPERNTIPSQRMHTTSRLRNEIIAEEPEISDTESIVSTQSEDLTQEDLSIGSTGEPPTSQTKKPKTWSQAEVRRRGELSPCWKAVCNSPCKRRPILEYLGETTTSISYNTCCNGCNPTIPPMLTLPPPSSPPLLLPRDGSRARFATDLLLRWANEQVATTRSECNRKWVLPSIFYMETLCIWQISYLFNHYTDIGFWNKLDATILCQEAPLVREWKYFSSSAEKLVAYLQEMFALVLGLFDTAKALRAAKAKAKRDAAASKAIETPVPLITDRNSAQAARLRDDTLAIAAARRAASLAAYQPSSVAASSVAASLVAASSVAASSVAASPVAVSPVAASPLQLPDAMLNNPSMIVASTSTGSVAVPQSNQLHTVADQGLASCVSEISSISTIDVFESVTLDTLSDSQTLDPVIGSPGTLVPVAKKRRRAVLAELDPNKGKRLTFSPSSRSGRKRIATEKGRVNFII